MVLEFNFQLEHVRCFLYVTKCSIKNLTFIPRILFFFVWISEQAEIITLYDVNWLDFRPRSVLAVL